MIDQLYIFILSSYTGDLSSLTGAQLSFHPETTLCNGINKNIPIFG